MSDNARPGISLLTFRALCAKHGFVVEDIDLNDANFPISVDPDSLEVGYKVLMDCETAEELGEDAEEQGLQLGGIESFFTGILTPRMKGPCGCLALGSSFERDGKKWYPRAIIGDSGTGDWLPEKDSGNNTVRLSLVCEDESKTWSDGWVIIVQKSR